MLSNAAGLCRAAVCPWGPAFSIAKSTGSACFTFRLGAPAVTLCMIVTLRMCVIACCSIRVPVSGGRCHGCARVSPAGSGPMRCHRFITPQSNSLRHPLHGLHVDALEFIKGITLFPTVISLNLRRPILPRRSGLLLPV